MAQAAHAVSLSRLIPAPAPRGSVHLRRLAFGEKHWFRRSQPFALAFEFAARDDNELFSTLSAVVKSLRSGIKVWFPKKQTSSPKVECK